MKSGKSKKIQKTGLISGKEDHYLRREMIILSRNKVKNALGAGFLVRWNRLSTCFTLPRNTLQYFLKKKSLNCKTNNIPNFRAWFAYKNYYPRVLSSPCLIAVIAGLQSRRNARMYCRDYHVKISLYDFF